MKRRDFLTRTAAGVSASLLLANVQSDGYRFVGSALAASERDPQKATLELKFAEFALSIKYEGLPADAFGNSSMPELSPLSGVKRMLDFGGVRAAIDHPKRTWALAEGSLACFDEAGGIFILLVDPTSASHCERSGVVWSEAMTCNSQYSIIYEESSRLQG